MTINIKQKAISLEFLVKTNTLLSLFAQKITDISYLFSDEPSLQSFLAIVRTFEKTHAPGITVCILIPHGQFILGRKIEKSLKQFTFPIVITYVLDSYRETGPSAGHVDLDKELAIVFTRTKDEGDVNLLITMRKKFDLEFFRKLYFILKKYENIGYSVSRYVDGFTLAEYLRFIAYSALRLNTTSSIAKSFEHSCASCPHRNVVSKNVFYFCDKQRYKAFSLTGARGYASIPFYRKMSRFIKYVRLRNKTFYNFTTCQQEPNTSGCFCFSKFDNSLYNTNFLVKMPTVGGSNARGSASNNQKV